MDVTPYLDLKIAPRAVFDTLAERRSRPRFMLQTGKGDWRTVTWGGFAEGIRNVGCYLSAVGLKPTERAAIFSSNRVEWMSAALGIQAAGGVMVPVYPASTPEQLGYVIGHSDARVVFADTAPLVARILKTWPSFAAVERIVLLSDDLDIAALVQQARAEGAPITHAEVAKKIQTWSAAVTAGAAYDRENPGNFDRTLAGVSLDQPGVMLYTSGTSGPPKGVPLTHRNVAVNGLDWLQCNASLIEDEAVDLLWLPMSHIFGYGEACLGNTLGFTTYLCEPVQVLEKLPEVRPSVFMSVPSVWEKLAQKAQAEADPAARRQKLRDVTGGRLTFCLSGGAGLRREVKEAFPRLRPLDCRGLRAHRDLAHADHEPSRCLPL